MVPHGEYDIFSPLDHRAVLRNVNGIYKGIFPNQGNALWFQGLISAIECEGNHLEYFSPAMSKDQINADYDFIIAPMANIFSTGFQPLLESLAERFRDIRIPVYVIACGVQADSYDALPQLCEALKEPASRFISNVYETGGEFALRGHFTKEFFHRLGFSSAVVTGCPSLYQMGRDHRISDEKKSREQFKPLLNGKPSNYPALFKAHPNAEFFDQDIYYHELWNPETFDGSDSDRRHLKRLVKQYGYDTAALLLHDRIRLIPGLNEWREYLVRSGFSFSYGSRIHGSIMPILAGIPAVLETRDARTREMAEFFEIPCVAPDAYRQFDSLYELYQQTSYEKFNASFAARFDAYEAFLKKCGIVERINQKNRFFAPMDEMLLTSVNRDRRAELASALDCDRAFWMGYDKFCAAKRKIIACIR